MCKIAIRIWLNWINLVVIMWADMLSILQLFQEREQFRRSLRKRGIYIN